MQMRPINYEQQVLQQMYAKGQLQKGYYEAEQKRLGYRGFADYQVGKVQSPTGVHNPELEKIIASNAQELVYKLTYDFRHKKWNKALLIVQIDKKPFAEGNMRAAYNMKDLTRPAGQDKYVAKLALAKCPLTPADYMTDVEMQGMCRYFAEEYCKCNPPKPVEFIEAFLIECFQKPNTPLMACEQYLAGEYEKFNNNYGYVSPDDRNTPQAFTHFTWEFSKHKYMVTDIQGVDDVYTDPQVHSHDQVGFGKGNVGMEGINKFLGTHKCNSICVGLGIATESQQQDFQGTVMKKAAAEVKYDKEPSEELLKAYGLSAGQYKTLVKAFEGADADKSGTICIAELPDLCKALNYHLQPSQMQRLIKGLDKDGDGQISLPEFLAWFTGAR